MSMSLRAFATITGENPGRVEDYATEYSDFGWNVTQGQVDKFMNEHPADAIYIVIARNPGIAL